MCEVYPIRSPRRLCLKALAVLPLTAITPAVGQTWTSIGPTQTTAFGGATGRVSALACSPSDPNLYFAAGADGGVWRSRDGGATWEPRTDFMPTTAMGALLIDPAEPRIIYAGTGEANFANHSRPGLGIYKSTDEGETWRHLAAEVFAGRCISRMVMDRSATPARLFASVTRAGGFPTRAAAKGHPLATARRGVWKSDDGGETWTAVLTLPDDDATDLALGAGGTVYAAIGNIFGGANNGVWRSVDRGDTWVRLAGGLPATNLMGNIALASAASMPSRIVALIARVSDASGGGASLRGAYRSDDAGTTWTQIAAAPSLATYGWYFTVVGINPADPADVVLGGLDLVRSANAGASSTNINIPHPDVHAVAFDAAGRLVIGCDGGVYRRRTGGWETLNTGLCLTQCYAGLSLHPTDADIMLVGLQDNGTVLRPGPTSIWRMVTGGDGGWTQIDQRDASRMFTQSQGVGSLNRSTNAGESFSGISTGAGTRAAFYNPFLIDPQSSLNMLYATERIYQSTTGGSSFTLLAPDVTGGAPAAVRCIAQSVSDPRWVYAATNDGRVLVSSDTGATFDLIRTGNPGWPRITRELFIDPTDPRTLYLAGAGYGTEQVLRTTDAGRTWEALDAGLPDIPVNTVAADVRTYPPRLFAGAEDGVYTSGDDGRTWERLGEGMPRVPTIDLIPDFGRNRLVAATQGRGVWVLPYVLCLGDFNRDGGVDGDDVRAFFEAWEFGHPGADLNRDGGTDGGDVEVFFVAWEAGC